jgi:hypothetical protein
MVKQLQGIILFHAFYFRLTPTSYKLDKHENLGEGEVDVEK